MNSNYQKGEKGLVNVLVVDDDSAQVELIRMALDAASEQNGHKYGVDIARNGIEAIQYVIAGNRPHYIILDLNMPMMGGIETAKELKNGDTKMLPIIILTSSDATHEINEAHQIGVFQYWRKPTDFNELVQLFLNLGKLSVNKNVRHPIWKN